MATGSRAPSVRRADDGLSHRQRIDRRLVGLVAAAGVIRFALIGHQGFWYDEAHTALLVKLSLRGMVDALPHSETTPPLYFIAAWVWAHAFGNGEAALRSLSAVAGVATIPVVHRAGRALGSPRTATVAAALATFNPLLVWYSQEARSYALLMLLSAIALLAFIECRRDPTSGWLGLWCISGTLALMTHYFAALLIAPEVVILVAANRHDRRVRLAAALVGVAELSLVPLARTQLGTLGAGGGWIHQQPFAGRLLDLPQTFAVGYAAPSRLLLVAVSAAVALAGVVALLRDRELARTVAVRDLIRLLAAGVLIVAGLLIAGTDELDARNVMVLWLPIALLVALGLERLGGWTERSLLAAICLAGLVAVSGVDLDRDFQRPDWRPLARVLDRAAGPGPRAIYVIGGCQGLPLGLYLPGVDFPSGTMRVRELDLVTIDPHAAWGTLCFPDQRAPARPGIRGFAPVGARRREGVFGLLRLRSGTLTVVPWSFSPATRWTVAGLHGILLTGAR